MNNLRKAIHHLQNHIRETKDNTLLEALDILCNSDMNNSIDYKALYSHCPYCGQEKSLIVSTDVNSGRICKNLLCISKKDLKMYNRDSINK